MNDPQPEGHMASYLGRRKFLATLGGVAAWPSRRARSSRRCRWSGYLGRGSSESVENRIAALHRGLKQTGYIEGTMASNTAGPLRSVACAGRRSKEGSFMVSEKRDDAGPRVDIIGRFQPLAQLIAHRAQRSGRRLPGFNVVFR